MGVNALRINMTESPEHKRGSPPTWPTANHLELGGQNASKGHKTYLSSRRSVRGCGRGSSNAATPAGAAPSLTSSLTTSSAAPPTAAADCSSPYTDVANVLGVACGHWTSAAACDTRKAQHLTHL